MNDNDKSAEQGVADEVNQALSPTWVTAVAQYEYYRILCKVGFCRRQAFQLLRDMIAYSRSQDAIG